MNNEFNEQMMEKQMAYNSAELDKAREYNSPVNARKRLEEAGINPYMALGSMGSQSVTSSATTSPASASGAAPMQGYTPNLGGVAGAIEQGIQMYNELENSKVSRSIGRAQMEQLNIENQYKAMDIMADIANKWSSTRNNEARTKWQQAYNNIADRMAGADLSQKLEQTNYIKEQISSIQVQTALNNKALNSYDEQLRYQFAEATARIELQRSQRQLTSNQAVHELSKQLLTIAQKNGVKISNDVARRTADELVKQASYTTMKMWNNRYADTYEQWIQGTFGSSSVQTKAGFFGRAVSPFK